MASPLGIGLFLLGVALDIVGFLSIAGWVPITLSPLEAGLAFLVVGIALDVVGLFI